ncbi:hypothetical protein X975_24105, partial [Stegodyphus mimosarum]
INKTTHSRSQKIIVQNTHFCLIIRNLERRRITCYYFLTDHLISCPWQKIFHRLFPLKTGS